MLTCTDVSHHHRNLLFPCSLNLEQLFQQQIGICLLVSFPWLECGQIGYYTGQYGLAVTHFSTLLPLPDAVVEEGVERC